MTDEQTPDVEDVKIRLSKDEIPVDDETEYKAEEAKADVVDELRNLGRQFGDTVRTAWQSEERRNFEREVRETQSGLAKGLRWFSDELGKLADSFTPAEKEPADVAAEADAPEEAPAEEESEA